MLNLIKQKTLTIGTIGLLSLGSFAASPAHAASIDLSTWNRIGDTSLGPVRLRTGSEDSVAAGNIETTLGLPTGSLNSLNPNISTGATIGSAIFNTIPDVVAGNFFSFVYNYPVNVNNVNARAFVTLGNRIVPLPNRQELGTFNTQILDGDIGSDGSVRAAIGTINFTTGTGISQISEMAVGAAATAVPEPFTVMGSVAAVGLVARMRQRFSKKNN